MPKFISVTDYGSGMPIWLNINAVLSIHRQPGTQCTIVKSVTSFEQLRESPEDLMNMIEEVAKEAIRS